MPSFEYVALDPSGARTTGVLSAPTEQAVLAELESRSLRPLRLKEKPVGGLQLPLLGGRKVSQRRLAQSYLEMGDLLKAGVPIMRALALLSRRKSQPAIADVYRHLAEHVGDGGEISSAMAERPDAFPRVHVAMVRAGEKGGFLEEVFLRLGQFVQAQADLRGKVIGNMIYPALLVSFGVLILTVVFAFFVPMFGGMFNRLEEAGQLPGITAFVFFISDVVGRYGLVTLAVLTVLAIVLMRLARRPDVRRALAVAAVRAPVIGPLNRALAVARFCRLLGTMEQNGVPLLSAMLIAKDAAGNVLLEEAIAEAAESVRSGEDLATPLERSGLFGDDVVEMIRVGEAAGTVGEVLMNIATTLEGRIDRLLTTAVRLIEPLLLLFIAGGVGFVAAALVLPLTRMSSAI